MNTFITKRREIFIKYIDKICNKCLKFSNKTPVSTSCVVVLTFFIIFNYLSPTKFLTFFKI